MRTERGAAPGFAVYFEATHVVRRVGVARRFRPSWRSPSNSSTIPKGPKSARSLASSTQKKDSRARAAPLPQLRRDPTLVKWYRQDVRREVMQAWLRASAFVVLAMLVLALPLALPSHSESVRALAWVLGGASLIAGPTYLLMRLHRVLGPDIYLAIHQAGIRWHTLTGDRFVAWSSIDSVRLTDGDRVVEIAVEGDEPLRVDRPLLELTQAELAEHLCDLRTKALMGIRLRE